MSISLTVNGQSVQVPEGSTVLDAINAANTYLSQLCKDPDMKAIGACRTCLVQVEGMRGFPLPVPFPPATDWWSAPTRPRWNASAPASWN